MRRSAPLDLYSKFIQQKQQQKQLRQQYQKAAKERSDKRKVNHIRATDTYVQSIENELVNARVYLSVKNLKEDFNEFTNKYKVKKKRKRRK